MYLTHLKSLAPFLPSLAVCGGRFRSVVLFPCRRADFCVHVYRQGVCHFLHPSGHQQVGLTLRWFPSAQLPILTRLLSACRGARQCVSPGLPVSRARKVSRVSAAKNLRCPIRLGYFSIYFAAREPPLQSENNQTLVRCQILSAPAIDFLRTIVTSNRHACDHWALGA